MTNVIEWLIFLLEVLNVYFSRVIFVVSFLFEICSSTRNEAATLLLKIYILVKDSKMLIASREISKISKFFETCK